MPKVGAKALHTPTSRRDSAARGQRSILLAARPAAPTSSKLHAVHGPLADGATIPHANQIALENGITLQGGFEIVREARAQGLRARSYSWATTTRCSLAAKRRAIAEAKAAGADGFIIVDLPVEEAGPFIAACRANDMSFVPLIAPTSTDARH